MKNIASKLIVLAAFSFTLLAPSHLFAQGAWTPAQQDVWKNVEAYWALDTQGNTEGFMSYFHDDYVGWEINDALPSTKADARKWIAHGHQTEKTLVYSIKPLSIKIHNDIAIVHYYWSNLVKDAEGKERNRSGRWTDILMKQGNKWVLIGDHGGRTSPQQQ